MLRGDQPRHLHEYVNVTDRIAAQSRDRFVKSIDNAAVRRFDQPGQDWSTSTIIGAAIVAGDLAAHIQVLLRRGIGQSTAKGEFEPHVFVGTHSVGGEDKLRLAFMGKVVAEASNGPCSKGVVVTPDGKSQRVVLAPLASLLNQILSVLRSWVASLPDEPPVILNDHCPICPFGRNAEQSRTRRQSRCWIE
jgi:hypothetical protein